MAVNGVEIAVGQVWALRNGDRAEIISRDLTDDVYPWETNDDWVTDLGQHDSHRAGGLDLLHLVQPSLDAPATPVARALFDAKPIDMSAPGYESLANVLQMAYNQAAVGKGVERHAAVGEPFDRQVMQIGAAKFGAGALLFQAFKKSEESQRLPHDRAVNELLGAIVYLAGAVIALEKVKVAS